MRTNGSIPRASPYLTGSARQTVRLTFRLSLVAIYRLAGLHTYPLLRAVFHLAASRTSPPLPLHDVAAKGALPERGSRGRLTRADTAPAATAENLVFTGSFRAINSSCPQFFV